MVEMAWRSWLGAAGVFIGMVLTAPALAQGAGSGLRLAAAEPRVAFLLGNTNYRYESRLDAVANDIVDMEKLLKGLGFRVTTLTDLNHQQLYAAATVTLPKLVREARNGVFLLYYSGHGMSYQDKGLLLPVDALIKGEDSVRSATVPVREFLEPLEEAGKSHPFLGIVILDTCREGRFVKGLGAKGMVQSGTPSVAAPSGIIISAATQPGNPASAGNGTRNSLYTGELLRFLGQPGLKLGEILGETALAVIEQSGGVQRPWVQPGDPSLALMALRAPTPAVPPPQPVQSPQRSTATAPGRLRCDDLAAAPNMGFGPGIAIDEIVPDEAIRACLQAVKSYPSEARFKTWLARSYYKAQQYAEAAINFQISADNENAESQFYLGVIFSNGMGVAADKEKANFWFRKSYNNGYNPAGLHVAFSIISKGTKNDIDDGLALMRKIATDGYRDAQFYLGNYYEFDSFTAKRNFAEAIYWYRKAADQGQPRAQYTIGVELASGQRMEKNEAEAIGWFRKAANQGWSPAQYKLGEMLENGRGSPKDLPAAIQWYRKAADQGHPSAQEALKRLK